MARLGSAWADNVWTVSIWEPGVWEPASSGSPPAPVIGNTDYGRAHLDGFAGFPHR